MKSSEIFVLPGNAGFVAVAGLVAALFTTPAAAVPAIPVTVTNTPTVNANVTNTSINVRNSSASPLFVDTGNAARTGMGSFCDVNLIQSGSTTGTLECQLSTVPAGQILVIETLTCFAQVVTGTPFSSLVLTIGSPNPMYPGAGNLSTLNHFLPLTRNTSGDYAGLSAYGLISSVRMYAFGPTLANGGEVPIYVFGNVGYPLINGNPSLGCTMSGHYESQ
jgi:hypothetical protein